MKRLAWTSLLLIVGCDMGRPYGAYMPRPDDDADAPNGGGRDDDDDDGGNDGPATGVTLPTDDGGRDGPEQPPPDSPLAAYAGTYLMRMDMYSKLSTSVATTKLAVSNRISNLLIVKVGVEGDDQLIGHETFCHQVYAHDCTSGCVDGWTTKPAADLASFFPKSRAPRSYRIDGDALVGERSVFALGFEEQNVSEATVLPKDINDDRLWKLSSGGVGLVTRLQTKVSAFGVTQSFDCEVSAVQLFGSSFEGALGEPDSPLEGVRFKLDVPALPAAPLVAKGTPTAFCNTKTITEQDAEGGAGDSYVRFRKTDIEGECPTVAVFDEQLPADPP